MHKYVEILYIIQDKTECFRCGGIWHIHQKSKSL